MCEGGGGLSPYACAWPPLATCLSHIPVLSRPPSQLKPLDAHACGAAFSAHDLDVFSWDSDGEAEAGTDADADAVGGFPMGVHGVQQNGHYSSSGGAGRGPLAVLTPAIVDFSPADGPSVGGTKVPSSPLSSLSKAPI